ncbi:hypothetical protein [Heyndrickxia coagulans]|uniref:hypothetical protein n=1 Tax=Heyndrickxia coagulans TaxID=1398 RepID=UPI00077927F8|nr:hypothetical protein [Heyndrickxia coagulans]KYC67177.1 hypothetical protein B4100_3813 [Heyndrickxia coagulans]
MAVNVTDADAYIGANVIVTEDWEEADEAKKLRILNVAATTLTRRFPSATIPDDAVYDFAAVLATAFNDTNKYAQQGISSYSVSGVATFGFANTGAKDLADMIPKSTVALINEVNEVKVSLSRAKWTVL